MEAEMPLERFPPNVGSKFKQFSSPKLEKIIKCWSKLENIPKSWETVLQNTSQMEAKMPQKRIQPAHDFLTWIWNGYYKSKSWKNKENLSLMEAKMPQKRTQPAHDFFDMDLEWFLQVTIM